ncbi:hypothetical protein AB3S75_019303 [Citrus x aurantiifolia]
MSEEFDALIRNGSACG